MGNSSPKLTFGSLVRLLAYLPICVVLLATLAMNTYVVASILRARTNVPWLDGWSMIRELMLSAKANAWRRPCGLPTGVTAWWS